MFIDNSGDYRSSPIVAVDLHPSEDVALFRLPDQDLYSPYCFSATERNGSAEVALWGYPDEVRHDCFTEGQTLLNVPLIYSGGYIRRRLTAEIPHRALPGAASTSSPHPRVNAAPVHRSRYAETRGERLAYTSANVGTSTEPSPSVTRPAQTHSPNTGHNCSMRPQICRNCARSHPSHRSNHPSSDLSDCTGPRPRFHVGGTFKRLSVVPSHHLINTFWAWRDKQLRDGSVICTSPSGDTYVTTPGSALVPEPVRTDGRRGAT